MNKSKNLFASIVYMKEVPEGHNTKVRRLFPVMNRDQVDPFLLFDYFKGKLPGGFPDHPHRGFETVSYCLKGKKLHEDFKGHKGELTEGDVQWMTAGKGIVHSEIPASDKEFSEGYQLWINLPKAKKMCEPRYQELRRAQIPSIAKDTFKAEVVCGEYNGIKGGIEHSHPVEYIVFNLKAQAEIEYTLRAGWNGFIAVSHGEIEANGNKIPQHNGAIFNQFNDSTLVKIKAFQPSTFTIITGKPLNEPMVRSGPFVMNTQEELEQAYKDYTNAVNGFEGRKEWKSQNSKLIANFHDDEDDL